MRTKQSYWVNRSNPDNLEWLIVTANYTRNGTNGWYNCLPMTDHSVFDHFYWENKPLRDLKKLGYTRVKLEECPPYIPKWAKRELE